MQTNCKNCDNNFEGNFCNNCGQTAHTHKINWHFVWHDIQHGIFHVDSGIIYTLKELFLRPGETIRNFIQGKRAPYFKPVAMIFLLATIYGLFYHYFHIELPTLGKMEDDEMAKKMTDINEWMASHYALSTLFFIPFYSLGSYMAFRKANYNYVEHGVLNLYLGSAKLVVNLLFFPVLYIYNNTPEMWTMISISFTLDTILGIYVYYSFFNNFSTGSRIFRTILSIINSYLFVIVIPAVVGFVLALFFLN